MSIADDLAALAVTAGITRAYPMGSVPKPLPGEEMKYPYAVIGCDTGTPTNRRLGGGTNRKPRRVTVQMFARTDDMVLGLAEKADDAFEDRVLAITGSPFSMREMQTPILRDPDTAGVLSILHTYKLLEA